jgi:hypothetical protein
VQAFSLFSSVLDVEVVNFVFAITIVLAQAPQIFQIFHKICIGPSFGLHSLAQAS